MSESSKCKLCGKLGKLCQSHIIPEFLFKPIYDDKNRMIELTDIRKKVRTLQKGLREPLLCNGCEQHINNWERYFKETWYDSKLGPSDAPDELIKLNGLNYTYFKLFHLSVLWRAGVASRSEFAQVNLGPHEPRLRTILLEEDPGPEDLYPFFAFLLVFPNDNRVCDQMVGIPQRVKFGEHWGYNFLFGGVVWNYVVSGHNAPEHEKYRFSVKGELKMLRLAISDYKPIKELLQERKNRGWFTEENNG